MIPVLYEKDEKAFITNGIGSLSDAKSCEVDEVRNGKFELEMDYPINGIHFDELKEGRIILAEPAPDEVAQPFEIYKIRRKINGIVTIYARHISYRLSNIPTLGYPSTDTTGKYTTAQTALDSLKSRALASCEFIFSTDVKTDATFQNTSVKSIRSLLGGEDGSIIDTFGGEYKWDRWTVYLLAHRGNELPIKLEYGKDITDLRQDKTIESMYTHCIAFWSGIYLDSTGTSEQEGVYASDLKACPVSTQFPYQKVYLKNVTDYYDKPPDKDALNQIAQSEANAEGFYTPDISITLKFVDLRKASDYEKFEGLESAHLCDTISVAFSELGISNVSAEITETNYDVLSEEYISIGLGSVQSTLSRSIESENEKIYEKANSAASQMIQKAKAYLMSTFKTDDNTLQSQITQNAESIKAEVTDRTNAEETLKSEITQNADNIAAEVSARGTSEEDIRGLIELKVGKDENDQIVSMLNASADQITLNSNRLVVNSTYFKLSANGTLTAENCTIKGKITSDNSSTGNMTFDDGKISFGSFGGYIDGSYGMRIYGGSSGAVSITGGGGVTLGTSINRTNINASSLYYNGNLINGVTNSLGVSLIQSVNATTSYNVIAKPTTAWSIKQYTIPDGYNSSTGKLTSSYSATKFYAFSASPSISTTTIKVPSTYNSTTLKFQNGWVTSVA